jgi:hypothetical protein
MFIQNKIMNFRIINMTTLNFINKINVNAFFRFLFQFIQNVNMCNIFKYFEYFTIGLFSYQTKPHKMSLMELC